MSALPPPVAGDRDPAGWRSELTLSGPADWPTYEAGPPAVVHLQWAASPLRPWEGVSPLSAASESGRLADQPLQV